MKKYAFLIIVAIVTIVVLFFLFNPQVLADIWLWFVGLIGPIVALFKSGLDSITNREKKSDASKAKQRQQPDSVENSTVDTSGNEERIKELEKEVAGLQQKIKTQNQADDFVGTTISVLRYFDDGETTLGLLFFEDKYYSYTLEDTYRKVKVSGQTRIPSGTYNVDFYEVLTELTKKYRRTRQWFDFHIHVQEVENFSNVYIHSGSDHTHTEGCLLIADSILSSDEKRTIFNSRKTYERFYKKIKKIKAEEQNVRIKILDEGWLKSIT